MALPEDEAPGGWRARLPKLGGANRPMTSWGGDGDDGDDEPRRRSSPGRDKPDAAMVAKTLGQLLLVLAGLAGWAASRAGRELRPPDERERADVAEPLSAILVRHVGAVFLTNDLVDGVRAAAGVTSYVQTSPLRRAHPEPAGPDLPDDYEEPGH